MMASSAKSPIVIESDDEDDSEDVLYMGTTPGNKRNLARHGVGLDTVLDVETGMETYAVIDVEQADNRETSSDMDMDCGQCPSPSEGSLESGGQVIDSDILHIGQANLDSSDSPSDDLLSSDLDLDSFPGFDTDGFSLNSTGIDLDTTNTGEHGSSSVALVPTCQTQGTANSANVALASSNLDLTSDVFDQSAAHAVDTSSGRVLPGNSSGCDLNISTHVDTGKQGFDASNLIQNPANSGIASSSAGHGLDASNLHFDQSSHSFGSGSNDLQALNSALGSSHLCQDITNNALDLRQRALDLSTQRQSQAVSALANLPLQPDLTFADRTSLYPCLYNTDDKSSMQMGVQTTCMSRGLAPRSSSLQDAAGRQCTCQTSVPGSAPPTSLVTSSPLDLTASQNFAMPGTVAYRPVSSALSLVSMTSAAPLQNLSSAAAGSVSSQVTASIAQSSTVLVVPTPPSPSPFLVHSGVPQVVASSMLSPARIQPHTSMSSLLPVHPMSIQSRQQIHVNGVQVPVPASSAAVRICANFLAVPSQSISTLGLPASMAVMPSMQLGSPAGLQQAQAAPSLPAPVPTMVSSVPSSVSYPPSASASGALPGSVPHLADNGGHTYAMAAVSSPMAVFTSAGLGNPSFSARMSAGSSSCSSVVGSTTFSQAGRSQILTTVPSALNSPCTADSSTTLLFSSGQARLSPVIRDMTTSTCLSSVPSVTISYGGNPSALKSVTAVTSSVTPSALLAGNAFQVTSAAGSQVGGRDRYRMSDVWLDQSLKNAFDALTDVVTAQPSPSCSANGLGSAGGPFPAQSSVPNCGQVSSGILGQLAACGAESIAKVIGRNGSLGTVVSSSESRQGNPMNPQDVASGGQTAASALVNVASSVSSSMAPSSDGCRALSSMPGPPVPCSGSSASSDTSAGSSLLLSGASVTAVPWTSTNGSVSHSVAFGSSATSSANGSMHLCMRGVLPAPVLWAPSVAATSSLGCSGSAGQSAFKSAGASSQKPVACRPPPSSLPLRKRKLVDEDQDAVGSMVPSKRFRRWEKRLCANCSVTTESHLCLQCPFGHFSCAKCLKLQNVRYLKSDRELGCFDVTCNYLFLNNAVWQILGYASCTNDEDADGEVDHFMSSNMNRSLEMPIHWEPMRNEKYKLVELPQNDEFKHVAAMFHKSLKFKITKVSRVQNLTLWRYYNMKKMEMTTDQQCNIDERLLFHGTRDAQVLQNICAKGFDWRYSGKHGHLYGHGSYFAVRADYSHQYCTSSRTRFRGNPFPMMNSNLIPFFMPPPAHTSLNNFSRLLSGSSFSRGPSSLGPLSLAPSSSAVPGSSTVATGVPLFQMGGSGHVQQPVVVSVKPLGASAHPQPHGLQGGSAGGPGSSLQVPGNKPSCPRLCQLFQDPTGFSVSNSSNSLGAPASQVGQCSGGSATALSMPGSGAGRSLHALQPFHPQSLAVPQSFTSVVLPLGSQSAGASAAPQNAGGLARCPGNVGGSGNARTAAGLGKSILQEIQGSGQMGSGNFDHRWRKFLNAVSLKQRNMLLYPHHANSSFSSSASSSSNSISNSTSSSQQSVSQGASSLASSSSASAVASTSEEKSSIRRMLLAKVLVGNFTRGHRELRRPPPLSESDPYGKEFDSCVDTLLEPSIHVVFDSRQSYPLWVIEYDEEAVE